MTKTFHWIDLTDFVLVPTGSCPLEGRLGHPSFDQTRTDGIDSHATAIGLISRCLNNADDASLARRIINATGIGAKACHRCGAQNGAVTLVQEMFEAVFYRQKYANCVDTQSALPILYGKFGDRFTPTGYARVGIYAVDAAIAGDAGFNVGFDLGLFSDIGSVALALPPDSMIRAAVVSAPSVKSTQNTFAP